MKAAESLPFLRDRLMEGYIWALGFVFEPQYSLARMLICKYIAVLTLMDDVYDSYGTIDELQLFTTALQKYVIWERLYVLSSTPCSCSLDYTRFFKCQIHYKC